MPKYRQLHVKIIDSFDFNEMPNDFIRVVWMLLPLIVDSEGRGIYGTWVRSKMFPLREDVKIEQVNEAMDWLKNRGMIVVYQFEGRDYFYIPTFKEYQSGTQKEGKSTLPAPPDDTLPPNVWVPETTPEQLRSNSGVTPDEDASNSGANPSQYNTMQCNAMQRDISFSPDSTAEKLFISVTGYTAIPGEQQQKLDAIDALRSVQAQKNSHAEEYLRGMYAEFKRRYPNSNRLFWLTDWAVTGNVPPDKKQPEETNTLGGHKRGKKKL